MKRTLWLFSLMLIAGLLVSCQQSSNYSQRGAQPRDLVGAWRANLQFQDGAFASIKDLEFLYVFNVGGTMTESSNYDSAPPVPPAYGIWRKVKQGQFEVKYEFFLTGAVNSAEQIISGGGWLPAGRGVFLESITLSNDGNSFISKIRYQVFDRSDKPTQGGGEANGRGVRQKF